MRFGKKLALQVHEDPGAPYLSHKPMKEAINRTVRELRIYQSLTVPAVQDGSRLGLPMPGQDQAAVKTVELVELEERVSTLDRQLFSLVDEDLARILAYIRGREGQLAGQIATLQGQAVDAGVVFEEQQLQRLEKMLPNAPSDRSVLSGLLLELHFKSNAVGMAKELESLASDFGALVDLVDSHTQYLEINVAGFRKLLKRHEKQIPHKFRSRPMPCLGFHRLVTHTSRQLLDLTWQLGNVLRDAHRRLTDHVSAGAAPADLAPRLAGLEFREMKGLGPECEMVLDIQNQLKDPMNSQIVQLAQTATGTATLGFLYPKPGGAAPGGAIKANAALQIEDEEILAQPVMQAVGSYHVPDQHQYLMQHVHSDHAPWPGPHAQMKMASMVVPDQSQMALRWVKC